MLRNLKRGLPALRRCFAPLYLRPIHFSRYTWVWPSSAYRNFSASAAPQSEVVNPPKEGAEKEPQEDREDVQNDDEGKEEGSFSWWESILYHPWSGPTVLAAVVTGLGIWWYNFESKPIGWNTYEGGFSYYSCPKAYLDIGINDEFVGRVVILLRYDVCPVTCENFMRLCTHQPVWAEDAKEPQKTGQQANHSDEDDQAHPMGVEKSTVAPESNRLAPELVHLYNKGYNEFGYTGSKFNNILAGCFIQAGKLKGPDSAIQTDGSAFKDENFRLKHDRELVVSMTNKPGGNHNTTEFVVVTAKGGTPWLDGKNVCFGRVIQGGQLCRYIAQLGMSDGTPVQKVSIMDSGLLKNPRFLTSTKSAENPRTKTE